MAMLPKNTTWYIKHHRVENQGKISGWFVRRVWKGDLIRFRNAGYQPYEFKADHRHRPITMFRDNIFMAATELSQKRDAHILRTMLEE